jgi:hypothetical protein
MTRRMMIRVMDEVGKGRRRKKEGKKHSTFPGIRARTFLHTQTQGRMHS